MSGLIKVRVYHDYYGCDTGCCGHTIELSNGKERFEFTHPHGESDVQAWARELAKETIRDCWPECLETIDWESLEVDVSDD